MKLGVLATVCVVLAGGAFADSAVVTKVDARKSGGAWSFSVTLKHADTGWEHYADGWGVYLEDGTELGYRVLHHPHVNEQPFTRSLNGVKVPNGVTQVMIVPRDSKHGVGEGVVVKRQIFGRGLFNGMGSVWPLADHFGRGFNGDQLNTGRFVRPCACPDIYNAFGSFKLCIQLRRYFGISAPSH